MSPIPPRFHVCIIWFIDPAFYSYSITTLLLLILLRWLMLIHTVVLQLKKYFKQTRTTKREQHRCTYKKSRPVILLFFLSEECNRLTKHALVYNYVLLVSQNVQVLIFNKGHNTQSLIFDAVFPS
jgi:hypothetical protein